MIKYIKPECEYAETLSCSTIICNSPDSFYDGGGGVIDDENIIHNGEY